MTPKPISPAEALGAPSLRVTIVTLDLHLAATVERARARLARELPGLELNLHAASEFSAKPAALASAKADIARADIVVATMLFLEDHVRAVLPALEARRDQCDAMLGFVASGEVVKLTKIGRLRMDQPARGPMALLKRLRGSKKPGEAGSGANQMAMLRRLPKILKYIPGTAQDLRTYFLAMQYWLGGSEQNLIELVRFLIDRCADGPRRSYRGRFRIAPPVEHPEVGLYHPRLAGRVGEDASALPRPAGARGVVGLVVMRAYVLAGDTAHYDGVIAALESRGLAVRPVFASGLDARPAIDRFFYDHGRPAVDAVVSLTGFSLVGGPAYNDAGAAEAALAALDAPYVAAHALEFQSLEAWRESDRGLSPVEQTMMVAIPEIDGATGPIVFGGRGAAPDGEGVRAMRPEPERCERLADRVAKLVRLRRAARAERRVAIVLYNFPPNAGATGTAAYLDVFASLHNTLTALRDAGYSVEPPPSVEALRARVLGAADGLAADGAAAAIAARVPVDDHVRATPWLAEIEAQWGPAPGRHQADGDAIHVYGARLGNVFVGVQPAFGYEGDPMRLLFEKGFAPTHAFAAFYRYVRESFDAHAVLHFGTHGALEFMPGKQAGLSGACWPDRLIGDLPNLYLYAANNPSEGMIAKRRSAATLISHLTPPLAHAGLYRGLVDLRATLDRWRALPPEAEPAERDDLATLAREQAVALDLVVEAEPAAAFAGAAAGPRLARLGAEIHELEQTLIPDGLHVIGRPMSAEARAELIGAMEEARAEGGVVETPAEAARRRADIDRLLATETEVAALIAALDGRFVRPAPGGDLIRTPAILPTGRNLHGFDPFRLPSAFALRDGARQAELLIRRYVADTGAAPRSVALVLWGADNLKSEGGPIAQALALMGARPRFDGYGRLCGAELIALEALGRPRIDVVVTLSGIFRDLLPLQTKLLAEAALLAASADEPDARNHVRAHARAHMAATGCDLATAALRVFSNADGAYGANVNQLVDSGAWDDEDELGATYKARKCYAYGVDGKPTRREDMLERVLARCDLAYQNLESVELGVTTIDHYVDTLGGVGRAIRAARRDAEGADRATPVYIGDQTRGAGKVRTLGEQVALETRTRALNPKWTEGMLRHGYEGVRQIEAHVTNTMGWSATVGAVEPWVYQQLAETYVLDDAMRARLAALNPKASARVANRLIEAHERRYWRPDAETLAALTRAGAELEDRLEGVVEGVAYGAQNPAAVAAE